MNDKNYIIPNTNNIKLHGILYCTKGKEDYSLGEYYEIVGIDHNMSDIVDSVLIIGDSRSTISISLDIVERHFLVVKDIVVDNSLIGCMFEAVKDKYDIIKGQVWKVTDVIPNEGDNESTVAIKHNDTEISLWSVQLAKFFEKTGKKEDNDRVSHPSHYTWLKNLCGIEVIDITRHMDFNMGNACKYLLRAGHKHEQGYTDKEKTIEDLRKAIWYINDEIKLLNGK